MAMLLISGTAFAQNKEEKISEVKLENLTVSAGYIKITENIRTYKVVLNVRFVEKDHSYVLSANPNSQFDIKYVNTEGKLVILRNYPYNGKPAILKNDEKYTVQFSTVSGYPLYLAISGYGFNKFDLFVDIGAKSDDGSIELPTIRYMKFISKDGDADLDPFCQKVILP